MRRASVIVPCYNGYRYIDKCLESLENQTYKDFEVIIVDDCSTDDTYARLLEYQKKSSLAIKVVHNEKNMRLALTRQIGVEHSESEWICFCDCDDWYEVDFLEKMFAKADSTAADMVMCHFNCVYADGHKKFLSGLNILSDDSSKEEYLAFAPMSLCRFIFKRHLYDGVIVPQINNAEDGAITPQLLSKSSKVAIVHEGLYNYFIHENSLSTLPKESTYYDFLKSLNVVKTTVKDKNPEEFEFIAVKNYCYGAILNGLKAGISKKIIKDDFKKFSKDHPTWYKNKYIYSLSKSKKLFLLFLRCRAFWMLKILSKIHQKLQTR